MLSMSIPLKGRSTPITCAHCGDSVYEYSVPFGRMERVVNTLTGCMAYSCYGCGRRGWIRHGRSNLWVVLLAKSAQVLIPLLIVLVAAILLFGFFTR